ncbi:hypothetical protein HDU87_005656 [Geranomyces variabilis]|uniref:Uncharacterized protein n=1 Tax=Geranomyces variabilis TaxID=109894 RepID=A0AAD5XNU6_9FUNG|nr:hypothetical protein HDU87_005656 [Geranomyces variabilis]
MGDETHLVSNAASFAQRGYIIIENAVDLAELHSLRAESDELFNQAEADVVADLGCILEPHSQLSNAERTSFELYTCARTEATTTAEDVWRITQRFATIARSLLPSDVSVHLFNEQYIVKPPHQAQSTAFAWHRDSDFMDAHGRDMPTVAFWLALDDVKETNGTIFVSTSSAEQSAPPAASIIGVPVVARAGTLVVIDGKLLHRSAPNNSDKFRRVYMPQFSGVVRRVDGELVALAVPMEK